MEINNHTVGEVKNWHDPHNNDCQHNVSVGFDCNCKRKQNRKPFRVVRVHDGSVGHGIKAQLSIEVHPNGRLVIREAGRRMRVETSIGAVYEQCLMRDARRAVMEKRKAKAERRKARRKS